MKQEESKKGTKNPPLGSGKPELSNKNTPQSLKAKSKLIKKSKAGKFKTQTNNGSPLIRGRKISRKNKKVVGSTEEKRVEAEKSKEKESQERSTSDKIPIEKGHQAGEHKIDGLDKSEQKWKNKEMHRKSVRGTRNRTKKDKHSGMENTESCEKKREKLGGFIFMCNAKTKPDCFHYHVLGVSAAKQDVVLGVKPGMKLFLYDFDLKLLYGIYKASSSGGMKLEPRAFGGNFPAQVRFTIDSDCFPLPESIFKKAIKENYDERNKFKTELTVRQVRKLTELFQPVALHSALQSVRSPPEAIIQDREAPEGFRGSWHHSHRERAVGDPYTNSIVNRYNVLSHERDPPRDEIPRDLFLTEKSYRAFGLQRDRRKTSASQVSSILEPYERENLHHLDPIYRENVPAHLERLRADPLHLKESEHQTLFRGAISNCTEDPYHAYRYGASPRDPYLAPLSRDEISSSSYSVGGRTLMTDNLQRRETVQDRRYSTYSAADALSEYNQMQQYHGERLEAKAMPVSSRYSFVGPAHSLL